MRMCVWVRACTNAYLFIYENKKRSCFLGENKNGLIIPMLFQIAAFICEPIMTAAGIVVYPENYLQYTYR